jgi:DNA helicase-2/ATP-dependent DNA helicase PcrA
MAALGEERDYEGPPGAEEGRIEFHSVPGGLDDQARKLFEVILPKILDEGTPLEEVAVLYRWAKHGDPAAAAARSREIPIVRADTNALVKRNSPMARLVEGCAAWVSGGWRIADPRFYRLATEAAAIVLGPGASEEERLRIQDELIGFLHPTIDQGLSAHVWLSEFRRVVLARWRSRARAVTEEWDVVDRMITRTDPAKRTDADMPLAHLGGRIEGSGRLNLSTLHSAKGREFDVVVLFGMNADILPHYYDRKRDADMREARRLFYVGVTRARKTLHLMFQKGNYSTFVKEVFSRAKSRVP